jgi:type IV pilus assembly protein PilC
VNIIDALTDLRDTVDNPAFRQVVAGLIEDIEGGQKLSEAMASHPYCFDTVFVALVRAGEQSGTLTDVLDELSENLKWQDEIASQARRAMTYPVIVFAVIVGVVFILMTVLVPQLASTFKTLVPRLPRETEILVMVSNVFVRWWYLMLGIPAAVAIGAWLFARTNDGAQRRLIGVSAEDAGAGPDPAEDHPRALLDLLRDALPRRHQRARVHPDLREDRRQPRDGGGLQRVGRSISEGQGISQAFVATKLFPPLVLRMLRVGESTGGLDTALLNVSYFYNRQVRDRHRPHATIARPATTIVLGLLIVAILYAIFLPIYDVISKIKF